MRHAVFITTCIIGLAALSAQAKAQEVSPEAYKAALLDMNRNPIIQNPDYSLGRNVLNRRLLDKNNRAIGKINDILLMSDGRFQAIEANINTGGFREDVSFNVESYIIEPTNSSFTVAMDKAQINQNMPQLLADIETASGEESPITLNQLRGANIRDPKGTSIAKVQDAVVRDRDKLVAALLVKVSSGSYRGSTMAIPYEAAEVIQNGSRVDLIVTRDQAAAITALSTRR